jgi:hypothetical protein
LRTLFPLYEKILVFLPELWSKSLNPKSNEEETGMKRKLTVFVIAVMFIVAPLAYGGSDLGPALSPGPAPNSGDGVSDGSGFDEDMPFFGLGIGPAPNSGDGIPDGSGF